MKRPIQLGEFSAAMKSALEKSVDGDTFLVPSAMHLHAFNQVLKESGEAKKVKLQIIGE
jgi:hypothetical protein